MPDIHVLIADDDAYARQAARTIINANPDMRCVHDCGNGNDAIRYAEHQRVDIALLDQHMTPLTGLATAHALSLASPTTRSIIMTAFTDPDTLNRVTQQGLHGFIFKTGGISHLPTAIRAVHQGHRILPTGNPNWNQVSPPAQTKATLTARQHEVLQLLLDGRTNQQISQELYLSVSTIKNEVGALMRRFDASSRLEIVIKAIDDGYEKERSEGH